MAIAARRNDHEGICYSRNQEIGWATRVHLITCNEPGEWSEVSSVVQGKVKALKYVGLIQIKFDMKIKTKYFTM
jgi:hypothetical protein